MISDRRTRDGFALPATLAVLGVVTLIFLVAITALASLTAEARSARDRVRFLERALTAEANLSYMAATEPIRPFGLAIGSPRLIEDLGPGVTPPAVSSGLEEAEVRLDGRPYLMDIGGPLTVSLQDQAGLVNLAALDDLSWVRLLALGGIDARTAQRLVARYRDYVDPDDLRQVDGAESADYGAGGGPANRQLLRPAEWLSVLGARDAMSPQAWMALRDDLAVDPTSVAINVNTATPRTLRVLFDLSEAQAQAALRARADAPFYSLGDLAAATGAPVVDILERVYVYPSGRIRFIIRDARSAWIYRGRLTVDPAGLEQPIWIDQTELSEAPRRARADTSDAARLPYAPR